MTTPRTARRCVPAAFGIGVGRRWKPKYWQVWLFALAVSAAYVTVLLILRERPPAVLYLVPVVIFVAWLEGAKRLPPTP
jgi:hypothetical protein